MFFIINQIIDTQLYMHMKNHHYRMNYLKLDWSQCYLQNVALQKSQSPFSFFEPQPWTNLSCVLQMNTIFLFGDDMSIRWFVIYDACINSDSCRHNMVMHNKFDLWNLSFHNCTNVTMVFFGVIFPMVATKKIKIELYRHKFSIFFRI